MKIYTRTGDSGFTCLLGGQRVSKHDPSPEACGSIDELNVEVGALVALLEGSAAERLTAEMRRIQRRLFTVGSRMAALTSAAAEAVGVKAIGARDYAWIERSIDDMDGQLNPLDAFILPGGVPAAVQAHRARTVCRRAERRAVALAEHLIELSGCHHLDEELCYLNRLADYLFVAARYCNHCSNVPEFEWHAEKR